MHRIKLVCGSGNPTKQKSQTKQGLPIGKKIIWMKMLWGNLAHGEIANWISRNPNWGELYKGFILMLEGSTKPRYGK
jgi:hypothetical protein